MTYRDWMYAIVGFSITLPLCLSTCSSANAQHPQVATSAPRGDRNAAVICESVRSIYSAAPPRHLVIIAPNVHIDCRPDSREAPVVAEFGSTRDIDWATRDIHWLRSNQDDPTEVYQQPGQHGHPQ